MGSNNILLYLYKKSVNVFLKIGLGKFNSLHRLSSYIRSCLKSDFTIVDGHKMYLDSLDSLELSTTGTFEGFETQIVKKIIRKGDTVIDLGANIGYYTLIFARLVGDKGKVFAFEPEVTNFQILKKNLEINNYNNVILEQKAVSNKSGRTKLFLNNKNKGGHTIYEMNNSESSIEINSIKLDDYFRTLTEKINFIKMDIEGGEADAVRGMSLFLKRNIDLIIMTEFNPNVLKKIGKEPLECVKLLKSYNFDIYHIDSENREIKPANFVTLCEKYRLDMELYTNLLCVKGNYDLEKIFNFSTISNTN